MRRRSKQSHDGNQGGAYTPIRLRFARLGEQEVLERSRAFLRRMRERRSVRHFGPDPVPRELIENGLRVAGSASSGANQQPWTFVVVADPVVKAQMR